MKRPTLAQARKAAVAAAGVLAQLAAAGLVPDEYAGYVATILAVATALGVYRVPNAPAEGEHRA